MSNKLETWQIDRITKMLDETVAFKADDIKIGDFTSDTHLLDESLISFCKGRIASLGSDGDKECTLLLAASLEVARFTRRTKAKSRASLALAALRLLEAVEDIKDSLRMDLSIKGKLVKQMI